MPLQLLILKLELLGILDMSGLRKLINVTTEDVLNGIAYNPKTKTIFVTGKNWDKMFEITVSE
jgi:glutamine cyclotransferase